MVQCLREQVSKCQSDDVVRLYSSDADQKQVVNLPLTALHTSPLHTSPGLQCVLYVQHDTGAHWRMLAASAIHS